MPRRRLTPDQLEELKFDDCRDCALVLSGACRGCDAGELFEDAAEPDDVFTQMTRYG